MTLAEFADTMPPPPPPRDELEAERRRANENAEAHFTALKQLQQVTAERDHARAELVAALREAKLEARARGIALQERDTALAELDAGARDHHCLRCFNLLGLSTRTVNALMEAGLNTALHVLRADTRTLTAIRGLGAKGLVEVTEAVALARELDPA